MKSFYLVSISAVRELSPGRIEVFSKPLMLHSISVREAAAVAALEAFKEWPADRGYSLHRSNISPVRSNAWDRIATAGQDKNLDFNNNEADQWFVCADFADDTPIEWPETLEH